MSELPVEDSPAVAGPARQAACGQVIHITEGGPGDLLPVFPVQRDG